MSEQSDRTKDRLQLIHQKITHENEHTAPGQALEQRVECQRQLCRRASHKRFDKRLEVRDLSWRASRSNKFMEAVGDCRQSNLIATTGDQVRQCRSEILHILELRPVPIR